MPRALSLRQSRVPAVDRDRFRARARETQAHYAAAGCNYWVFEARAVAGAYVEFFEAPDAEILMQAHRGAADPTVSASTLYVQVELS